MRRWLSVLTVCVISAGAARAHGLLIPKDKTVPPLAMLNHQVNIAIEDQVAVTRVEQTFRNHTDRPLEATYVFPVPKGASVQKFTMWVGASEVAGELVEAAQARKIYTDIVRRTQDPGLLEYLGNNLFQVKVFPVAAHGDQKLTLSFTSVAPRDSSLVEYVYPLKTDGKATRTLEKFSIQATIKAQHPIQNVYSPTHAINVSRPSDRSATINFEKEQALLDKDFQLFYAVGDKDVGLTALTHRPVAGENGYVMLLISPRVELSKSQVIPRDMVMVLDTSGSMRGVKMDQAKKALKYCLNSLGPKDRFGMMNFATTVNKYTPNLVDVSTDQIDHARKWVDKLEATGGTAIDAALSAALGMRSSDPGRTLTIIFFTDGCPTVGETNPDKILKNVAAKNTANTRIFTFGVGDDVNATMLDQLADQSRAVSTYVRPVEDIEVKVSSLYSKISNPVLANLKIATSNGIDLAEVYPPQLPDLFHGGELVVLGRFSGKGPAAVTLTGNVGMETREFVYEMTFPEKTTDDKSFVEHLWARRKVGYLLDQIRANGEKNELVDETVALAKKYGIATPYTSYLIVPDAPVPVVSLDPGRPVPTLTIRNGPTETPVSLRGQPGAAGPQKVADFAKEAQKKPGQLGDTRGAFQEGYLRREAGAKGKGAGEKRALQEALEQKAAYDQANKLLAKRDRDGVQTGKLGVDLSVQSNNLRAQNRLTRTAQRNVYNRNCLEIGGVWIDESFDPKMKIETVKAMSDAYFRILERHPKVKEVFQLGNHLVWVTPSGTALVIDCNDGKEQLSDDEIDRLFVAMK
jgi:Ca-activated chloride channel family protein